MKLYTYPYWKNMVAYYYGNDIQNRDGFLLLLFGYGYQKTLEQQEQ